jgi:hypothetical protein
MPLRIQGSRARLSPTRRIGFKATNTGWVGYKPTDGTALVLRPFTVALKDYYKVI